MKESYQFGEISCRLVMSYSQTKQKTKQQKKKRLLEYTPVSQCEILNVLKSLNPLKKKEKRKIYLTTNLTLITTTKTDILSN